MPVELTLGVYSTLPTAESAQQRNSILTQGQASILSSTVWHLPSNSKTVVADAARQWKVTFYNIYFSLRLKQDRRNNKVYGSSLFGHCIFTATLLEPGSGTA